MSTAAGVESPWPWIHLEAPAKLNTTLSVGARRADGYHPVDTRLVALDWVDWLAVRARPQAGIRLEVRGPAAGADVPRDARNLAWRAAATVFGLARAAAEPGVAKADGSALDQTPRGLEMVLDKELPSQAGLGGGSSDAAAAWRGAALALGHDPGRKQTGRLLAEQGSDTAFFALARATGHGRCTGRGERVDVLPAVSARWCFALFTPAAGASTAEVYGRFVAKEAEPRECPDPLAAADLGEARARLVNDLESAALAAVASLAAWRALLDGLGFHHWRLSGSGSSFFGLEQDPEVARESLDRVLAAARERGLVWRAARVARPRGRGACELEHG